LKPPGPKLVQASAALSTGSPTVMSLTAKALVVVIQPGSGWSQALRPAATKTIDGSAQRRVMMDNEASNKWVNVMGINIVVLRR
jgi:hypothetical protein